ncbi:CvpA family protein [Elioraea rosea]|uniref:CvpA family protein n=1 Tax=Elioraea rosea TaxID=2492390 RepID=UPI0011823DBC|nr:CvpA family protein [Elioraea rosea]
MTPSVWLDIAVLAVVLVSGLLAMMRGFVREVLGIAAWAGAAVAAFMFYPLLAPHLHAWLEPGLISNLAAGGAIFIVVLIVLSLLSRMLSDRVQDSAAGSIDRTLGLLFGLARGALIVCVAYIGAAFLAGERQRWPDWLRESQAARFAEPGAAWIVAQLPPGLLPPPPQGAGRPSVDQLLRPAPASPAERGEGYRPDERRDLDRLLNTTR